MTTGEGMSAAKRFRQVLEAPFTRLGLAVIPFLPRRALLGLARFLGGADYTVGLGGEIHIAARNLGKGRNI